jgi:hypothetical protein
MRRQLVSLNQAADGSFTIDDLVGKFINSKEEFDTLHNKLLDRDFRNKTVLYLNNLSFSYLPVAKYEYENFYI